MWNHRDRALFRQVRAGLMGKPFTMFKFRSMAVDSTEQRPVRGAQGSACDARRPVHPQVPARRDPATVNVLIGDVSLIGPRPEQIPMVEDFEAHDRLLPLPPPGAARPVRLGAGAAGIVGTREETVTKLSYDLYYVSIARLRWTC
ncbi:sugar transferase [Cupriavidus basilensis]